MNHLEVAKYWEENADNWTMLARMGADIYRDYVNTPAFFRMLPPVEGLKGLDVGCGEGHNTRLLADKGADVAAFDITGKFLRHAFNSELDNPKGIRFCRASALELPFPDGIFDFATAFMSIMDMPDQGIAFREIHRVLKSGGFLQFSITHPCFVLSSRRNIKDEAGMTVAVELRDYFKQNYGEIEEWIFSNISDELKATLPKFKVPYFDRTLSDWLNTFIRSGFALEEVVEPVPSDEAIEAEHAVRDSRILPHFLIMRGRKG